MYWVLIFTLTPSAHLAHPTLTRGALPCTLGSPFQGDFQGDFQGGKRHLIKGAFANRLDSWDSTETQKSGFQLLGIERAKIIRVPNNITLQNNPHGAPECNPPRILIEIVVDLAGPLPENLAKIMSFLSYNM